jgi:probable F420-dependent oxidoreductase
MKFGAQVRATAGGVDLSWIARELEWRGFESIFLPEHTHVPVAATSKHPGGEELMDPAKRGLDPFVGLAFVAAATFKLRIGTGVCLLPQHDAIVLAKQIATLDRLSGGRVIFGAGAGWAREEMANHGVDPAARWAVLREKVLALKAIWTHEQAEFHGDHVSFDPIWQWPKPLQSPHPPVLLGLDGPSALKSVVEYGDGWMPNFEHDTIARAAELQRLAVDAGRGPIPVTAYSVPENDETIAACKAAGLDRVVFNLPSTDLDETCGAFDRLTDLMKRHSDAPGDAAG